jgi:anti-sigma B factor antagonist
MLLRTKTDAQIDHRQKEGVRILDLRGPLIIGDSEANLRSATVALAETKAVKVILNLKRVTEIDDDGLDALIYCYARTENCGGQIKLLNPPPDLNVMVLTKLDTVFEVFTDEQDAVNSFFPDRTIHHYDILEWIQEQDQHPTPEPTK